MKTLFLAFFISTFFATSAFCHLGETQQECEARYGEPLKTFTNEEGLTCQAFQKSGLNIGVTYLNGKACQVGYFHQDQDLLKIPAELSDNEIEIILKSNSDAAWKQKQVLAMGKFWQTPDESIVACYNPIRHILVLMTKEMNDFKNKSQKAQESKNLQGL